MTKPAAFVLQLIGLILILVGAGSQGWITAAIGGALIVAGGIGVRRRIKRQ